MVDLMYCQFKISQCYFKEERYTDAIKVFDKLITNYLSIIKSKLKDQ